ncbi:unnamed protein product, partial [Didymodactylos carnosus]
IEHLSIFAHTKYRDNLKIINVNSEGIVDIQHLAKLLSASNSNKKLVSIILANNETGVIQNIKELVKLAKKYGAAFHSDCVQAVGKIAVNIKELGLDFATISSHKLGGMQGSSVLVTKQNYLLKALIVGGGQEKNIRAGTENVLAIASFGLASEIAALEVKQRYQSMKKLQDYLELNLLTYPNITIASKNAERLPNTTLMVIAGGEVHTKLISLDLRGIAEPLFGWEAEEAVEVARGQVAKLINAEPKEIIFTSGATEANNLAIKGIARFYGSKKKHIITAVSEHKCVLDACRHLEDEGFEVTYLPIQANGLINLETFKDAVHDNTMLVSIMAVNNETGVIQPLKEIGKICRERGIFFHSDIAQGYGKIPIDVNECNIDLASISAHKIYGPKGIGALYVRKKPRVRLVPIFNGGGQERGMRSGTLPTPLIVGLGVAAEIALVEMEKDIKHVEELFNRFYENITKEISEIYLNGDKDARYKGNLNLSFAYVEGESLILAIKDLAVSSGSACTSSSLEPSYVLRSMGVDEELAHTSIRFGIGRFTTHEEIDYAVKLITSKINNLRDLSPLWEMVQEGIDLKQIKWATH